MIQVITGCGGICLSSWENQEFKASLGFIGRSLFSGPKWPLQRPGDVMGEGMEGQRQWKDGEGGTGWGAVTCI